MGNSFIPSQTEWLKSNNMPSHRNCPRCKQGELDTRVHRGFFVKFFLGWLPLKRYRCNNCSKRSYIWIGTK